MIFLVKDLRALRARYFAPSTFKHTNLNPFCTFSQHKPHWTVLFTLKHAHRTHTHTCIYARISWVQAIILIFYVVLQSVNTSHSISLWILWERRREREGVCVVQSFFRQRISSKKDFAKTNNGNATKWNDSRFMRIFISHFLHLFLLIPLLCIGRHSCIFGVFLIKFDLRSYVNVVSAMLTAK